MLASEFTDFVVNEMSPEMTNPESAALLARLTDRQAAAMNQILYNASCRRIEKSWSEKGYGYYSIPAIFRIMRELSPVEILEELERCK